MSTSSSSGETIVQDITIDAPAERVFEAFTNPSERARWWNAPDGRFSTKTVESDLRPGGKWTMRGTRHDGAPFIIRGEYRVVKRPALLEFTWLPDWQGDDTVSLVRVEFTETDGVTHVRLTHSGLTSERSRGSHRGWPQILDALRAYVERR
jgi:glutathione S-transferase